MRSRDEIARELEADRRIFAEEVLRNRLFMEVLLDIRELLLEASSFATQLKHGPQ